MGGRQVPLLSMLMNAKLLRRIFPFIMKVDNFNNIPIRNFVFSSLLDEEVTDEPQPSGVLHLYNKLHADIHEVDLVRINLVRKFVGSMIRNCEWMAITVHTLVGC
jgi:hypothetical protein